MSRLWPSSLLGQVLASVALALLVAQIVSGALLYRAGEDRREAAVLAAAGFRLINGAQMSSRSQGMRGEGRNIRRNGSGNGRGLPRSLRYSQSPDAPMIIARARPSGEREQSLRDFLLNEGIDPVAVRVVSTRAGEDPDIANFMRARPRLARRTDWRDRRILVAAIQRTADGPWETARVVERERQRAATGVIVFQTLVIFAFLMAILFLVLRRITRPLARLTQRVDDFSRNPETAIRLIESGPADTRKLIAAHNAMEARVAALLDEKDVMLGAIGHDLKTPLAALRVRIESVTDETQRARMADTIEDLAATLDDILSLARVGKTGEPKEAVDLAALMRGIVEECEDLSQPVTIADPPRIVAQVHATWLKRALRNLVANAVRYGGTAHLTLYPDEEAIVLRVEDEGPGIAQDRIAQMLEPFARGEESRNRATGGAGLGLAIARAIAAQHGGQLVLENRAQGGLRAEIRLPRS